MSTVIHLRVQNYTTGVSILKSGLWDQSTKEYRIFSKGFAMESLLKFIENHEYTVKYRNRSIRFPTYTLGERK